MTNHTSWTQHLNNWTKALRQLEQFVKIPRFNELEELGVIHSFEINHDLSWNLQKNFMETEGIADLFGPRNVARKALVTGLINDYNIWMDMIESRKIVFHDYHEKAVQKVVADVVNRYYGAFSSLHNYLTELARKRQYEGSPVPNEQGHEVSEPSSPDPSTR